MVYNLHFYYFPQMLIQHCIAGLVLNLTLDQVRDVEGKYHYELQTILI